MRLSFFLASALTFGLASASVLVPRAPATSGISSQCEASCNALSDQANSLFTGGGTAFTATATVCSNSYFQNIKSCFECGYNLAPTAFPADTVRTIQQALDTFAGECTKLGFPVTPITLNSNSNTSKPNAALSSYEGSVRVVGAVGVAAVAGFLAL